MKSCVEELVMRFVLIVMHYSTHFKKIKDINFLKIQGEFLKKYFEFAQKYLGLKFTQEEQNNIKYIGELYDLIK